MVHQGLDDPGSDAVIEYSPAVTGAMPSAIVAYDNGGFWIQNSWVTVVGQERLREDFVRRLARQRLGYLGRAARRPPSGSPGRNRPLPRMHRARAESIVTRSPTLGLTS